MSEPVQEPVIVENPIFTDDQQLAYTQKIRRDFIDHSLKQFVLKTGERGDKALVLQALNDMDRSALTNKKIKTDGETGVINAKSSLIIASMLSRMGQNSMSVTEPIPTIVPPSLPDSVPPPELAAGETEINAAPMNYKMFIAEQNRRLSKTDK